MIDIADFSRLQYQRGNRWHKGNMNEWSALEWAGAVCGEAGEAANAAKKLRRIEMSPPNINEAERQLSDIQTAQREVAKEVADTIIYGLSLLARVGYVGEDAERIIKGVFNAKSEEYGFPERL